MLTRRSLFSTLAAAPVLLAATVAFARDPDWLEMVKPRRRHRHDEDVEPRRYHEPRHDHHRYDERHPRHDFDDD